MIYSVASVAFDVQAAINLIEGQTATVCIDISDTSLLNSTHPPTVVVATLTSLGNALIYHCVFRAIYLLCGNVVILDESDYIPVEETLVLDPSALEQRKCVDIETVNDEVVEPIELFAVELRDPVGVVLESPVSISIGIEDDGDGKFTYSITNSNV